MWTNRRTYGRTAPVRNATLMARANNNQSMWEAFSGMFAHRSAPDYSVLCPLRSALTCAGMTDVTYAHDVFVDIFQLVTSNDRTRLMIFEVIECRTRTRWIKISLNQRNTSCERTLSGRFSPLSGPLPLARFSARSAPFSDSLTLRSHALIMTHSSCWIQLTSATSQTYRGSKGSAKRIPTESIDEARLAHARITDEHDLEDVFGRRRSGHLLYKSQPTLYYYY